MISSYAPPAKWMVTHVKLQTKSRRHNCEEQPEAPEEIPAGSEAHRNARRLSAGAAFLKHSLACLGMIVSRMDVRRRGKCFILCMFSTRKQMK